MGLIVDTSELVNAERIGGSALDIVALYGSNEKYVISVMTVAELQHGIARADSPTRRLKRERFLSDVLQTFEVCPFDIPIAVRMGNIDGHLKERGLQLPVPDLIIAATALELEFAIATHNLKDFNRIPGLQIAAPKV